ncbi:MAG TPA: hypothetical protein VJ729_08640, partial [Nitrososphaeraceae archaeon]|nr:hypothetical protein [Nitrososphaeraceae archaeon]
MTNLRLVNSRLAAINTIFSSPDNSSSAVSLSKRSHPSLYSHTQYDHGMNVSEYEKQGLLIIGDALERYFGEQNIDDKSFKINLVNNAK